jgi:arylformamidase
MSCSILSHSYTSQTPTYGNQNAVLINQLKSIERGDTVNESSIDLPLHAGTHLDFPRHFFEEGQSLCDFPTEYWVCKRPLVINVEASGGLLLNEEITNVLDQISQRNQDILLVKILPQVQRDALEYIQENYGISAEVAEYLRVHFPSIKFIGINSISLSSYRHREAGKLAHRAFLAPDHPIMVIEDMDLTGIDEKQKLRTVLISPLMVPETDGVPVTVWAETYT